MSGWRSTNEYVSDGVLVQKEPKSLLEHLRKVERETIGRYESKREIVYGWIDLLLHDRASRRLKDYVDGLLQEAIELGKVSKMLELELEKIAESEHV